MSTVPISAAKTLSPLVRIILTQAIRRRANGGISAGIFAAQLTRLAEEELKPKGLNLVLRDLSGGRSRFVIRDTASGAIFDTMDFAADGTVESESGEDR
ncbi:MAG: hypothetical protein P4L99_14550 [Chthoniobacter sp.]|nr:hypothetical protein [Chthoniobacter sp.]